MGNDKPRPHWQFLAERYPSREEVARIYFEQDWHEAHAENRKFDRERKNPKRPIRQGPPDRRIGAPDTRAEHEQQERRLGATNRRTPGSDRRNTKRTAG